MVAAGSITVAVRVRPPTSTEAARLPEPCYESTIRTDGALSTPGRSVANTATLREVVQVVDDRILTFDPAEKDRARAFVERGFMPPGTKRYKDRRFMFDKVFTHDARQQEVYEGTSQPLLKGLLEGYNATVFAYGATGCGKTHTISGTDTDPGIIYMTMADLFQRIDDRRDEWNVEVMVTFLEIYNEEIRDLLAEPGSHVPRGGLQIREDKSVKVVGLAELKPNSAEEVKAIVLQGNLRRTQSPTHANETSSRSHAVLQVHITQSPRTASLSEQNTMATLSIIDLAGSERAAATTNMGQRMVEGANINKSLLALGNCINALCESGGAIRHVPYRNSKLTRLLKFSLGGNCKTVMIVCVAPTSNHFDDTHNTLVYAERATKIKTRVVTRNVVNVDRHVGQYVEAINRLNSEIAELKAKLSGRNNTDNDIVRRKKKEASVEVERAKNDLKVKVEQTKSSIIDGAACTGKLSIAKVKLGAIRARLSEIDAKSSSSSTPLSPDLEAERLLLQGLAGPEELAIKSDSALNQSLRRSSNSRAMFDATMRAVSERRSEKLDEVSIDNVKLDAKFHKAEIDALKAEQEKNVMKEAVEDMAQTMVGLVGMLGRCTVMVGEAAKALGGPFDNGPEDTARRMAMLLGSVKEKNDEAFMKLVGRATSDYVVTNRPNFSLESFKGYDAPLTRRISSGPAVLQTANTSRASIRRSSNFGTSADTSSRSFKSPRKSLRSSLASQPYRRVPDKERQRLKAGKSVQWRDEAGEGDIDDGGALLKPVQVTVIPATPTVDVYSSTGSNSSTSSRTPPPRSSSLGGSESEWEDENERTDDSVNMNMLSMSLPASTRDHSSSQSSSSRSYGSLGSKRSRPSRLDPSFLKSKNRTPTLGSLAEDDESQAESPKRRVSQPLGDRSLNQSDDHGSGGSSDGHGKYGDLHAPPKGRHGNHGSPGRRVPSTPRGTASSKSRRRSNVGPMRSEKGRRRSSMIPQLSPPVDPAKPRRVLLGSPGKKPRRISLTRSVSAKPKPVAAVPAAVVATSLANTSVDPAADLSFSKFRPTWR